MDDREYQKTQLPCFLFFSMFALMEVFFPVSLWQFPTSSHILAACYINGHCVKFLFPFIQTIF